MRLILLQKRLNLFGVNDESEIVINVLRVFVVFILSSRHVKSRYCISCTVTAHWSYNKSY